MDKNRIANIVFQETADATRGLLSDSSFKEFNLVDPFLGLSARVIAGTAMHDLSLGGRGHILRVNEHAPVGTKLFQLWTAPFDRDKCSLVLVTRLNHWLIDSNLRGARLWYRIGPSEDEYVPYINFKDAILPFLQVMLEAGRVLRSPNIQLANVDQVNAAERAINYLNPQ